MMDRFEQLAGVCGEKFLTRLVQFGMNLVRFQYCGFVWTHKRNFYVEIFKILVNGVSADRRYDFDSVCNA